MGPNFALKRWWSFWFYFSFFFLQFNNSGRQWLALMQACLMAIGIQQNSCWPIETKFKKQNTTKSNECLGKKGQMEENSTLNWEEYEHKDLNKKLQMFCAEVCTKDGFFYDFVENNIIINKKSYYCSCISWYMATPDVFKVLKLHLPVIILLFLMLIIITSLVSTNKLK